VGERQEKEVERGEKEACISLALNDLLSCQYFP
jgi:hypothetical protein